MAASNGGIKMAPKTATGFCVLFCVGVFGISSGYAQLGISTFGATDAEACYRAASDNFSTRIVDCDEALRDVSQLSKRDVANTHVNRGIILNRAERPQKAIIDFNKALSISPGIAEAFLNRGNSFFLMSRFDDALSDYQRALDLGINKSHAAWYNIGLAYEAMKMPDKAEDAFRQSEASFPNYGPATEKLKKYNERNSGSGQK